MKIDYYPWNARALVDWTTFEKLSYKNPAEFAAALEISLITLLDWTTSPEPVITLDHLYALAKYRRCTLAETIEWLGITSSHLDFLISNAIDPLFVSS